MDFLDLQSKSESLQLDCEVSGVVVKQNNIASVKEFVSKLREEFGSIVFTEDQIKDAKTFSASINKMITKLKDEKKKIKNTIESGEYGALLNSIDEVIKDLTDFAPTIKQQIDNFENKRKEEKKQQIIDYFNSVNNNDDVVLDKFFDEKWLNKTEKMEDIKTIIDEKIKQINNELLLLKENQDGNFPLLLNRYKQAYDLADVLNYKKELEEQERRKKEFLQQKENKQVEKQQQVATEKATEERRNKVFAVNVSKQQLELLNQALQGFHYKQLDDDFFTEEQRKKIDLLFNGELF